MFSVFGYAVRMRKRLSRAESQELTRQRLIEAGTKLYLRDGFKATSLDQVAEEAGYSRGAVHSNFSSKAELGSAVLDELYRTTSEAAAKTLRDNGFADFDDFVSVFAGWVEAAVAQPDWIRLEMEVAGASAYDEETRAATAKRLAHMRSAASTVLAQAAEESGIALPADVATLTSLILSTALGLGFQYSADPSLSPAVIRAGIELLLGKSVSDR